MSLLPQNERDYVQALHEGKNPDEYGLEWLHQKRREYVEYLNQYKDTVRILSRAINKMERKFPELKREEAKAKPVARASKKKAVRKKNTYQDIIDQINTQDIIGQQWKPLTNEQVNQMTVKYVAPGDKIYLAEDEEIM